MYWYNILSATASAPFGFCPCCGTDFNSELTQEYNIKFCPFCGENLTVSVKNSCKVASLTNNILNNYFIHKDILVNCKIPDEYTNKYNNIDNYTISYIIGTLLLKHYKNNVNIFKYFTVNNYFIHRIKKNVFVIELFDNDSYYFISTIILKSDTYCIEKEV